MCTIQFTVQKINIYHSGCKILSKFIKQIKLSYNILHELCMLVIAYTVDDHIIHCNSFHDGIKFAFGKENEHFTIFLAVS